MSEKVKLPVRRNAGSKPMVEAIEVERVADLQVRLCHSPGAVEGLAAGDVIELLADSRDGFRIVSRGGNVCVWFFFERATENRGPDADRLRSALEAIGGRADGGGMYSLVFTVPVSARISRIADVLDGVARGISGSAWMFGNVYDAADGKTPLRWWPAEAE